MKKLIQQRPDAILCLNGVCPPPPFFAQFDSLPLIAADGAASQLLTGGITPNVIVGDMDSFTLVQADHHDIPVYAVEDQESNDFEKCLNYCLFEHFRSVLVCGAHGGDLEHTLNNWSIMMRYAQRMNLCIYDAGRCALPVSESVEATVAVHELISLIPQPQVLITTEGLQWPLTQDMLELGQREGARNRALAETIRLHIHQGSLLLFLAARLPEMPVIG